MAYINLMPQQKMTTFYVVFIDLKVCLFLFSSATNAQARGEIG